MGNLKKTLRYLKRNGIVNTGYAVMERLLSKKGVPYSYIEIDEETLKKQREWSNNLEKPVIFSILVPVYETKEEYLREMIESCLNQTYGHFELILADASVSDNPKQIINSYTDKRIKYVHLPENRGISGNTNAALEIADGEYCALLDHDDLLTLDALYENAVEICGAQKEGIKLEMLYSDEDKTDSEGKNYSEPHYKQKLNLDLLLSNNYICHFTVIRTELIKSLGFRPDYDGSQDYDMFLRTVGCILFPDKKFNQEEMAKICHLPKILYHWRCHEASTAFDPASKEYAYAAGKKAIRDFVKTYFGNFEVTELAHKGFYRVNWKDKLLERSDVGAVGGLIYKGNKIISGIFDEDTNIVFEGMNRHFSGYMNHAALQQQVFSLDIRNLIPADSVKVEYEEIKSRLTEPENMTQVMNLSFEFSFILAKKGLALVYDPMLNRDISEL